MTVKRSKFHTKFDFLCKPVFPAYSSAMAREITALHSHLYREISTKSHFSYRNVSFRRDLLYYRAIAPVYSREACIPGLYSSAICTGIYRLFQYVYIGKKLKFATKFEFLCNCLYSRPMARELGQFPYIIVLESSPKSYISCRNVIFLRAHIA